MTATTDKLIAPCQPCCEALFGEDAFGPWSVFPYDLAHELKPKLCEACQRQFD